ncbi:MAG: DUF2628 domain-containing protein [Eubacterium sp.]|jgi:hypothetical protein|nr:DUF2628 domain-containing protein [Eubacterium sp.]
MYCRNCGSPLNERAEVCIKCGCYPNNGNEYCQECGAATNEKQEICIKCGCRLRTAIRKNKGLLDTINNSVNGGDFENRETNLNFSNLAPYYQREFQKIYNSGETYKGKFNIWGVLFGAIWALTKGCWLSAIIAFAVSFATMGIGGIVYSFIYGFRGTYMYYCAYVKDKQCII